MLFGIKEMKEFAEESTDERVKSMWRRMEASRSKSAKWAESHARMESENARLTSENTNLLNALQWLHDEIDTHFFCGTETMSRSMQDAYNEAMELLSNLAGD